MMRPRLKTIRRLGTPLPGLSRKEPRRPLAAAAGPRGGPRRSDYRRRLEEKQKVRWNYGLSEAQLRRAFAAAAARPGPTGQNLLTLLEQRLDNVVFRLGFAPTIPAARQLVAHGHVRVGGVRVDRPGYRVSPGESIALSPRARRIPDVAASLEHGPEIRLPGFLSLDREGAVGRMTSAPERADVPFLVDESAIVEFYAR